MNLRSLLSDLETDWIYFPWTIEKYLWNFKGTFLVAGCGSSFYTYCILVSLSAYNDLYPNNISIYYYNIDNSAVPPLVDTLLDNNKIQFYSQETSIQFSWLILDSGHNFEAIESYKNFFNYIRTTSFEKAIFISDYRIYPPTSKNFNYSEQEISTDGKTKITSYYQTQESLFRTFINCTYCQSAVILRAGHLVGACDSHNIILNLICDIAQKEKLSLTLDNQQYPSIYIGDFLRAVFWCCRPEKKGFFLYNLSTSNLTLSEVAFSLRNLSCSHAKIVLSESQCTSYGIGLNTDKLSLNNWHPLVHSNDYILYAFAHYKCPDKQFSYSDYCTDHKLDKIHGLLLDMLIQVDSICRKHNIQYFLAGGTLLGAVRNQGFLPWDNDLDLMMTRKNYNQFIQIAKKELPDYLFLQSQGTDPENHFYSKIRLNNTLLVTPFNSKFPKLHNGIFLDIFPQDQTADSLWKQKLHIAATIIARSMVFNKWGNTSIAGDGSHPFTRALFTLIKNCLPMHILETIQYKIIRLFEYKQHPKYLYDGMGQNIRKGAFPAFWLEEAELLLFENRLFPVPCHAHEYLEYLYGPDYQYPVPLIKRKLEHNIQLTDLGPYI